MPNRQKLPPLSRVEFFLHRADELAVSLARAIESHREKSPKATMSPQHKAVSAWAAAAVDVPNGGFVQFFYNRRGDRGVAELADLLDRLDLSKAATILRDAAAIYRRHRKKFHVSDPWDGLFGSIEEFDKVDRAFVNSAARCGRAIDAWIADHIGELATDETGAPIATDFTGTVEIRSPSGQILESLEVKKGKPHGAYREFFEDGTVRSGAFYRAGRISEDVWPDGSPKRKESRRGKLNVIEWFYPNGALQKRYVKNKDGYAAEPIRLFHENGQLAEELTVIRGDKRGPWLKFFDDGTPELQAEYAAREKLIVHNAWNAQRQQVVRNGSGLFRDYPVHIDWEYDVFFENDWPRDAELQGGIPHGTVKTYHNGVLWDTSHFVRGVRDGESTTYWDNGRIRLVTKYVRGKAGKSHEFPKFDRPSPAVVLKVEADDRLYKAWRHIAVDEYPRVLNLKQIQKRLKVPSFLQDVYERNVAGALKDDYEDWNTFNDGIAYFLTVDAEGNVTAATANGSGVYSGGEWGTYPPLLRKLRFSPGRVRGRAIECRVLACVDHTFVDRMDDGP